MWRQCADGGGLVLSHCTRRVNRQLLVWVHRDQEAVDLRIDFIRGKASPDAGKHSVVVELGQRREVVGCERVVGRPGTASGSLLGHCRPGAGVGGAPAMACSKVGLLVLTLCVTVSLSDGAGKFGPR